MEQRPYPGQHLLAFCGDTMEFTLRLPRPTKGEARLRTNIGHVETARDEIVGETQCRQRRLAEDWFDIPMTPAGEGFYRLTLPLLEVGHFEAKTFFLPAHETLPWWPQGANTVINVHPSESCCANTLYNAFVRQFGKPLPPATPAHDKQIQGLTDDGYAVIPPSGTFRDLIRELDFIVGRLRCRMLLLLPIHPTPTVYGRMGTFGSPYAALDFMEVDPALAEFDRHATPMEQFQELVDAVHARRARLLLDIAINHTGWAGGIHTHHPEWLVRGPDGRIQSPGAWGVTWEDLTALNHNDRGLWNYLAKVFLFWCRRGVDGFRCDAGYMIPIPAWEFIVAKVRREFPDTVFLLEGLGGSIDATTGLLSVANLTMAYSELFQNYDRAQIEGYLPQALRVSESDGLLMHFAETHDNTRLAAKSIPYAGMRTALAALCSSCGAFAFANGVEWFATERIDVHNRRSLNWGARVNQVDLIARLNSLLASHPAFFNGATLRWLHPPSGAALALLRHHPGLDRRVLVLINLDETSAGAVEWDAGAARLKPGLLIDLLSGRTVTPARKNDLCRLELPPAEALCLSDDPRDLDRVLTVEGRPDVMPDLVLDQTLRARAMAIIHAWRGLDDWTGVDVDRLATDLAANPRAFCRRQNRDGDDDRVVAWTWPTDLKREVMVPPGHFLYVTAAAPFRARIEDGGRFARQQDSLPQADGRHFVLFVPPAGPLDGPLAARLKLSVFDGVAAAHVEGRLLFLPPLEHVTVPLALAHGDLNGTSKIVLSTNGRGGMMRAAAAWGELRSRYDALLAGNLSPAHPEDRRIMLTRCRGWLVFQGYSQDITLDRLLDVSHDGSGRVCWRFRVPFGHGQSVAFDIQATMVPGANAVRLRFHRRPAGPAGVWLADRQAVHLILRPDVEDRGFHEVTKAFAGPESAWPPSVRPLPDQRGFTFGADPNRRLRLVVSTGTFHVEPEWQYMIDHPVEAERGLERHSDLFSPGYFRIPLTGNEEAILIAQILTPQECDPLPPIVPPDLPFEMGGPEQRSEIRGQRSEGGGPRAEIGSRRMEISAQMPEAQGDGGDVPTTASSAFFSLPGARPLPLSLPEALRRAMRHYIARRGELKTVIAGYPWFLDWGRDTLICARGLIAAGRLNEVAAILKQFAAFERDGTLPNVIFGKDASNRDTTDAPLWLLVACADAATCFARRDLLRERCGDRTLIQALESVADGYRRGTPNGIRMDPETGLIFSPAHFTWMDTNFPAGTPREGYPVEIQALWYAGLAFLAQHSTLRNWRDLATLVRESLVKFYWSPERGYLTDCLHARPGVAPARAEADDALRPNQLLALTLGAIEDRAIGRRILNACADLLVPGAIRSLADRPVLYPQPIIRDGTPLNDPRRPYWGRYEGDEDTRRKPAYHNGTAWTWLFPSFSEAWFLVYGESGRNAARAWLGSSAWIINRGCLGQLPEIVDGDAPHTLRGCDAQAWGVTELYRVLQRLEPV